MSRSFRARSFASLLFLSFFQVSAQSAPARLQQVSSFEQYVVYWTTEPGWRTELQLRNNLDSSDLTVAPAVRTPDGAETALPLVTIKSGDVVSLDLYDSLLKVAPQLAGSWGSLVLRYSAVVHRALYAAVMVEDVGHPIAFHLDAFGSRPAYDVGSRESIWWMPRESVTGYLILTNQSGQTINPNLLLYDSSGKAWRQKLSLSARETKRLSIRSLLQQAGLTGSYGGMRIDMNKGAGFLDSAHLLFDEPGGFSAEMKMFTHDPGSNLASRSFGGVKEWTTRAPMLALSDPDPALGFPAGTTLQPKLLVRNATARSFTAHLRFSWRSATTGGKTAPIDLPFAPNQTQTIDVAALQAQKLLPVDARWAAVILSAPVQPDDLLAVAASYDQTGRYGTQTPFSDQLASHWEAGKWEVDSMHNSLVTIGNGGNKPERAQLTILYNQGSGKYQVEQTLAPDEQIALDFGKLIRDQVPDKNGHTLPLDLTYGTYRILDLTDSAAGGLYEGKVILDKTYGHAAYGCAICCGPEIAIMGYYPLDVTAGSWDVQEVLASNSCGGGQQNVTGDFPTWWTDNTAIATATGSKINGIAPGTTDHHAQSVEMYWGYREYYQLCPKTQETTTAPTNVAPTVTISGSGYLALVAAGATGGGNTTTFTASGTPSGGTYSWTAVSGGSNVTLSNTNSATVTVQATAVGSYTLQVTYTVNSQPGTATAVGKVQQPGSLGVVSNTTVAISCSNLPGDYTTEERLVQYQVLDTSDPPVAVQALNMRASESLTFTNNGCSLPPLNPSTNVVTGTNGYFPAPDMIAMCSVNCLPANNNGTPTGTCTDTVAQTWAVNGYPVKSDTVAFSCTGPPTGVP